MFDDEVNRSCFGIQLINHVKLLTDYIYASNDLMFAGDVLTDILSLHKKCKDQVLYSVKLK